MFTVICYSKLFHSDEVPFYFQYVTLILSWALKQDNAYAFYKAPQFIWSL